MALPRNPIGTPTDMLSLERQAELSGLGAYIPTSRQSQGSWATYLDSIRRVPGSGLEKEPPVSARPGNTARPGKPVSAPTRSQLSAQQGKATPGNTRRDRRATAGRYNAAPESRAGTPEANYAAGIRRYGAGMRSAPNIGAVRNKGGYNERDRRLAAQREANLATGDALSRVRTMGG